ncbi:MAG: pyridoxamine 5'-phosphate oxidase family protein [Acidimicrobiales bacterium]|nr:pyridoxamine 5'-phosphate oxidase family protein [Acidimicrobiales bacterium]
MRITSKDQLRELYRQPSPRAAEKTRDRIDEATARFISLCPLAILSTAGADGTVDASPRGGPAGFIKVIDERHVAVPDLGGNNRLDSFQNIIANPHAGLLLMVPGKEETVRINGPAHLSIDSDLLASFTADLRPPKMALVVETQELFAHCAKAFRRSGVWKPASWALLKTAPDLAEIYECQFPSTTAEEMRATLEQVYADDLARD